MKKVIHKSDSGFADGPLNDKASIVKSDSGFPEEEDDDDQTQPEKLRDPLSVEDAHKLFHKRFAATARAKDSIADHSTAGSSGEDEEEEEDDDESIANHRQAIISKHGLRSQTNSTESLNNETNLNVVALKEKLQEIEEKFCQAMVVNSSLDNDKSSLTYRIELLKDQIEEAEEETAMIIKEFREKNRAYELLKQQHMETRRAVELLQKQLVDQSRLLGERGMVLVGDDCDDLPDADDSQEARTQAIVSKETALILSGLGKGPLDTKIKGLADERDWLRKKVKRLELDLKDEQNKTVARKPLSKEEMEVETKKLIKDYKFKLQKDEQDILVLQANVSRLELQVTRFQGAAESGEQSEMGLKADKKKLERELCEAMNKIEELETANRHLQGRMEKLKTAKSNLLKEL